MKSVRGKEKYKQPLSGEEIPYISLNILRERVLHYLNLRDQFYPAKRLPKGMRKHIRMLLAEARKRGIKY